MDQIPIKLELPDVINKALTPLAQSIGTTLSSIWDITFGWINNIQQKVQAKRLKALNEFKESLEKNISDIPTDNLCEPDISVVGPAMEASKYYFEQPEIREMFASLIAKSMDSEYSSSIHPAFVEIIKQLSPIDAVVFRAISKVQSIPLCKVRIQEINNLEQLLGDCPSSEYIHFSDILLSGKDCTSHIANISDLSYSQAEIACSIENLERLALVSTTYPHWTFEASLEAFKEHPYVQSVISTPPAEGDEYILVPGDCDITNLGQIFAKICL